MSDDFLQKMFPITSNIKQVKIQKYSNTKNQINSAQGKPKGIHILEGKQPILLEQFIVI